MKSIIALQRAICVHAWADEHSIDTRRVTSNLYFSQYRKAPRTYWKATFLSSQHQVLGQFKCDIKVYIIALTCLVHIRREVTKFDITLSRLHALGKENSRIIFLTKLEHLCPLVAEKMP